MWFVICTLVIVVIVALADDLYFMKKEKNKNK